jgi:hypothetical protein
LKPVVLKGREPRSGGHGALQKKQTGFRAAANLSKHGRLRCVAPRLSPQDGCVCVQRRRRLEREATYVCCCSKHQQRLTKHMQLQRMLSKHVLLPTLHTPAQYDASAATACAATATGSWKNTPGGTSKPRPRPAGSRTRPSASGPNRPRPRQWQRPSQPQPPQTHSPSLSRPPDWPTPACPRACLLPRHVGERRPHMPPLSTRPRHPSAQLRRCHSLSLWALRHCMHVLPPGLFGSICTCCRCAPGGVIPVPRVQMLPRSPGEGKPLPRESATAPHMHI